MTHPKLRMYKRHRFHRYAKHMLNPLPLKYKGFKSAGWGEDTRVFNLWIASSSIQYSKSLLLVQLCPKALEWGPHLNCIKRARLSISPQTNKDFLNHPLTGYQDIYPLSLYEILAAWWTTAEFSSNEILFMKPFNKAAESIFSFPVDSSSPLKEAKLLQLIIPCYSK